MLEKIKRISWVEWLLLIAMSISLLIIMSWSLSYVENVFFPEPWSNANGVSTEIAMEKFTGETVFGSFMKSRIAALTGILLYFIIGPMLLILYGYGREQTSQEEPTGQSAGDSETADNGNAESRPVPLGFRAGIVITLMGLLPFAAQAVISPIVQENTRTSSSKSKKKDELRHNLLTLAVEAYEYMVLPEKYGGGDGSFRGLSIEELPHYENLPSGTYQIKNMPSDTVLQITGSAVPDYPASRTDSVTITIQVQPTKLFKWIEE